MTNYIFLDNNLILNFNSMNFIDKELKNLQAYDKKEKRFLLKDLFRLTKNINKLQDNLIESLTFHNEFLSNISLPDKIDIEFLNTNIIEKSINNLLFREKLGQTLLYSLNDKKYHLITISTDFSKKV